MSLTVRTIHSGILGKDMNLAVYCPDGYENTDLPVLYFLHGRSGNETLLQWLGIDKTADELISTGEIKPFIIVCPNLDNSRGINSSDTYREIRGRYGMVHQGRYEDYLIREVIPYIDNTFHTVKNREGRYIGGISSGGYTALYIGLRYQELFSKVGGHMPAIDLSYADEDEPYFADEAMWLKYDPVTIAENGIFEDTKVFLDDGKNDEGQFFRTCDKLYSILKAKGVDVQNHLFTGSHNGEYVLRNMKTYLCFYGN
ncbi:alpha/beta hydrolase [Ruminococcus sp.]|uniref:alpha/beta hydrolase n=1 Tax=Ruminococcus sp. TaxID=41978 RepID=UPI00388D6510